MEVQVLGWMAVATAAATGWALWKMGRAWKRRTHYRQAIQPPTVRLAVAKREKTAGAGAMGEAMIAYATLLDGQAMAATFRWVAPMWLRRRPWPDRLASTAGLHGRITNAVFWEARTRAALLAALSGALVGLLFSFELSLLLGCVGIGAGWRLLPWALGQRSRARAEEAERHLSEMMDVVALGLRSGLSFERSLVLYLGHFDTMLADSFAAAHRQWSCGLASRVEALRTVAASYDSPLLARVIENIIRSLRFGSTLADNLEDAAKEARNGYRARKQERVAKAPVKMMVPTGALILPAMLLLVLGPVLLELVDGF